MQANLLLLLTVYMPLLLAISMLRCTDLQLLWADDEHWQLRRFENAIGRAPYGPPEQIAVSVG